MQKLGHPPNQDYYLQKSLRNHPVNMLFTSKSLEKDAVRLHDPSCRSYAKGVMETKPERNRSFGGKEVLRPRSGTFLPRQGDSSVFSMASGVSGMPACPSEAPTSKYVGQAYPRKLQTPTFCLGYFWKNRSVCHRKYLMSPTPTPTTPSC